jgi:hypothetical protein
MYLHIKLIPAVWRGALTRVIIKMEPSSGSRDGTPATDKVMGIAEKIKSEGRARKAPSVSASSDRGTPAPPVAKKASSPGPPPPKAEKPPKKKGTAASVKKAAQKSKFAGMLSILLLMEIGSNTK